MIPALIPLLALGPLLAPAAFPGQGQSAPAAGLEPRSGSGVLRITCPSLSGDAFIPSHVVTA